MTFSDSIHNYINKELSLIPEKETKEAVNFIVINGLKLIVKISDPNNIEIFKKFFETQIKIVNSEFKSLDKDSLEFEKEVFKYVYKIFLVMWVIISTNGK